MSDFNPSYPECDPLLGWSSVAPGTSSPQHPRGPPSSPPPAIHTDRRVERRRVVSPFAHRFENANAPEAVVFSLLERMSPDMLQYVCNFLPTLNDIYNMRRVFKAARKVDNDLFRRAVFNRAAVACINADAWHRDDPLVRDVTCGICSSTFPPIRGFHILSRCTFPYCLSESAIRPAAPLPQLAPPANAIPHLTVRPGRVGLVVRRGPVVHGATVLLRWRQFDRDAKSLGPWTIQYGGYRHSQAKIICNPGVLDSTKLVQFSFAVRVKVCTCPFVDDLPVPASACYTNHRNGHKCDAVWTPWSPPSIPVYPPNEQEADIFRRRITIMNRVHEDAETVFFSGSGSDSHADSGDD